MRRGGIVVLCLALLSCTDAGLYSTDGEGPNAPDRAQLEGIACVPLASGDSFPVRVVYAFPGGEGVSNDVTASFQASLESLQTRFSFPYIQFSILAYHTNATGIVGRFVEAAALNQTNAIQRLGAFNESGPISLRYPLRLAESIVSGDMQTGCRGLVARTRYLVVLVITGADRSCSNPAYNAGLDTRCDDLMPDETACSQCELRGLTDKLKALAGRYLAGEVSVQPIYVRTTPDPLAVAQAQEIARSGGTQLIQTDPAALGQVLNSLNYASLQRELRLKRLIALNRNAIPRAGRLLLDSDEDGLADEDEAARGTDPLAYDTDLDGLGDGVEVMRGMDPLTPDTLQGCNSAEDGDFDRLNDCEERVLGTDSCIGDSDGDTLPDVVELVSGTNPLLPEDQADDDRDGFTNIEEVVAHTDPKSADLAWRDEHAYGYSIEDAPPTPDGRACYRITVRNVGLVSPPARPNPPYDDIAAGTNDLYLYMQVGRDNDPRGTGIGSLFWQPVVFVPPATRDPAGVISLTPEDFVVGN